MPAPLASHTNTVEGDWKPNSLFWILGTSGCQVGRCLCFRVLWKGNPNSSQPMEREALNLFLLPSRPRLARLNSGVNSRSEF